MSRLCTDSSVLKESAKEGFGDMVKAVVDIERKIMALAGELHADEEAVLLHDGSKQENLWGINIYVNEPRDSWIEFDSMINLRPAHGNLSNTVEDPDIQKKLKEIYRFHTIRAGYLYEARNSFKKVNIHDKDIRNHLVKKIKGLGMKESSHFLRNIGFKNVAIIDFHIMDLLARNGLIEKPKNKSLTPKKYLEIENVLKKIAKETGLNLGELDLYLWYEETGKILK